MCVLVCEWLWVCVFVFVRVDVSTRTVGTNVHQLVLCFRVSVRIVHLNYQH